MCLYMDSIHARSNTPLYLYMYTHTHTQVTPAPLVPDESGLPTGALIGIIIGAIILAVCCCLWFILFLICVWCCGEREKKYFPANKGVCVCVGGGTYTFMCVLEYVNVRDQVVSVLYCLLKYLIIAEKKYAKEHEE